MTQSPAPTYPYERWLAQQGTHKMWTIEITHDKKCFLVYSPVLQPSKTYRVVELHNMPSPNDLATMATYLVTYRGIPTGEP